MQRQLCWPCLDGDLACYWLFSIQMIIWKCGESLKVVKLISVVRQWEMAAVRLCCSFWLVLGILKYFLFGILFLNVQTPWSPDFRAACSILLGPAQGAGIMFGKLPFVKIFPR